MLAVISYPPIPIFDVGPIQMSLHGLFAALGFIAGGWYVTRLLTDRGFSGEAFQSVLSWALVGSLLGARYSTAPAAIIDGVPLGTALAPLGNFSIMGGFAGGILAGWWKMRRVGLPRPVTFDTATYGLAIGTIVGRIGDLAIVEHLGRATTLPWGYGIRPGDDVAPQHDALECVEAAAGPDGFCGVYHHVAAYDMLGAVILFFVLGWVARRFRLHYGQLFSFWIIWYGLQRFLLDFLRFGMGDATLGDFTWNQISGLAAALLGAGLFAWFGRREPVVSEEADRELATA